MRFDQNIFVPLPDYALECQHLQSNKGNKGEVAKNKLLNKIIEKVYRCL